MADFRNRTIKLWPNSVLVPGPGFLSNWVGRLKYGVKSLFFQFHLQQVCVRTHPAFLQIFNKSGLHRPLTGWPKLGSNFTNGFQKLTIRLWRNDAFLTLPVTPLGLRLECVEQARFTQAVHHDAVSRSRWGTTNRTPRRLLTPLTPPLRGTFCPCRVSRESRCHRM